MTLNIDLFIISEILIVILFMRDYNSFLFDHFCVILFLIKIITAAYSPITLCTISLYKNSMNLYIYFLLTIE